MGNVNSVTPEIGKVFSELKVNKGEVVIPANSKVRLVFKTFCLDHGYSAPDAYVPTVFSYEKIDMPFFPRLRNT